MSTTIDVDPTTAFLPLVEETRFRTAELYTALLRRKQMPARIEIGAYVLEKGKSSVAPLGLRWRPGLALAFEYLVDGEVRGVSWPCCDLREEDADDDDVPPGGWWVEEELRGAVEPGRLAAVRDVPHFFHEYRNAAGPAVSSIGYGLVAVALAEPTDGIIASFDYAFEPEGNGMPVERFLTWWGDRQIGWYGTAVFASAPR